MLDFGIDTGIKYTEIITDDSGKRWLYINGAFGYDLDKWTEIEAQRDFLSDESIMERFADTYSTWAD